MRITVVCVIGILSGCGGSSSSPTPTPPTLSRASFVSPTSQIGEAGGIADVLVSLEVEDGGTLNTSVQVSVEDAGTGTATPGLDYVLFPPTVLTFPAGTPDGASQAVQVQALDDALFEPTEGVQLVLQAVSASVGIDSPSAHDVMIADEEVLMGGDTRSLYSVTPDPFEMQPSTRSGLCNSYTTSGLAFDPASKTLYACDLDSKALLQVDTVSGAATFIGNMAMPSPSGLAWDPVPDTLYAVNNAPMSLYTVDPSTGEATHLVDIQGLGGPVRGLAYDSGGGVLYGLAPSLNQLVIIDKGTGMVSLIGTMSVGFSGIECLAFDPGSNTLYGVDASGQLVAIDPTTGVGAAVGGGVGFSGIDGLAWDPAAEQLYGVVRSTAFQTLVCIDPATGIGVEEGHLKHCSTLDIGFHPGTGVLHASSFFGDLMTIDLTTAQPTVIGEFGVKLPSIAFAPDGTLYGYDFMTETLVTIDPSDGATTALGPIGAPVYGLACHPDTGELYSLDGFGALYSVNRLTGAATFLLAGPGGAAPSEFFVHPTTKTFYVRTADDQINTVDLGTNARTPVTSLVIGGITGLSFQPGTGVLYGVRSSGVQSGLVTVDLMTGRTTSVRGPDFRCHGLAYDGSGAVYASLINSDLLFRIDPATGQTTTIGYTGVPTISDLAYGGGVLYAENTLSGDLYSLDTTTGMATLIGNHGGGWTIVGLAYDSSSGMIYGTDTLFDDVVLIDPMDGSGSTVGSTMSLDIGGLAVDGMTGKLYGCGTGGMFYEIDKGTGLATAIASNTIGLAGLTSFR